MSGQGEFAGLKGKSAVIWLTGFSGSGKTTIANQLVSVLKNDGVCAVKLDGDDIRQAMNQTGFDEASRKKHNLNVGYMASMFEKQGNIVVVSLISPYEDIRNQIRTFCQNFVEIYLSTDLETCIQRDPKGLYKKALNGEINDFTGISAPYYPPLNPEIELDTAQLSIEQCTLKIIHYLQQT